MIGNSGTQKHTALVYAIPLVLAVLIRAVILFAAQPYFFGGDLYTYVAFSHEIRSNSFILPQTNTLHFPGSSWIFPPLVPYIVALLDPGNTLSFMYVLTWFEIALSSLTVIPLVQLSKKIFGDGSAFLSGLIYSSFPGFIYLCMWGDLAQIIALLLFAFLLNQIHSAMTTGSIRSAIWAVALTALIGVSHDLTFFITILLEFVILIYAIVKYLTAKSASRGALTASAVVFVFGLAIGGLWYFLHYSWITSILFGGGSFATVTPSLSSLYTNFISALSSENGVPYGFYPYSFFLFILLAISIIYAHHSLRTSKVFLLDALVIVAIVPTLLLSQDAVLVSRFMYFLYVPYALFGGIFLYFILSSHTRTRRHETLLYVGKTFAVVAIALYLSFAVIECSHAHTYYIAGEGSSFQDEQNIASWLETQVGANETVAAPQTIGFSLMALGNIPVLVSENASLLSQPFERNQSQAATTMIYNSFDPGEVHYFASLYNIEYVVSNETAFPSYYSLMYSSGNYSVFEYTG